MARWKALPDELDPRVTEFVGQLRLLVDRSGLGIAAVADRTGYSRTSWERYLNGGLLAPKGAVVALAEATGASPVHLATMWELAERAWSRSEMRHDSTMEAIRVSRARAALGEFGPPSAKKGGWGAVEGEGGGEVGSGGPEPEDARPAGAGSARRKRRLTVFLTGVVGVLVVGAAAVYLTRGGEKKDAGGTPKTPAASVSARPDLPPGVKCSGASCTGKDPETMGCGGRLTTTTTSVTVGTTLVEVRYSKTCGAAWARATRAGAGDRVEVSSGGAATQTAVAGADVYTYTPMVAVKVAGSAKACAVLRSGQRGCTS
ncbi:MULTISPECIES: DUF2690 domain-containing protein [unclassified Streptomyces]|uniref:helix-turn-helix domain-containing protein n=1 Tax=unclassified Streptomyces TaxID=2593676 RepID=UPI0033A19635